MLSMLFAVHRVNLAAIAAKSRMTGERVAECARVHQQSPLGSSLHTRGRGLCVSRWLCRDKRCGCIVIP